MKKGIIFSTDAMYGTIVLIIVLGTFSTYYSNTNPEPFHENINIQTADTAIVGFYTNTNAIQFGLKSSLLTADTAEFQECLNSKQFLLAPETSTPTSQSGLTTEKKYCKWFKWEKE